MRDHPLPDSTEEEVWRPIPSARGRYEASNFGRIRSAPQVLRASKNHRGYYVISIRKDGGVKFSASVGRLVAEAFLGRIPDGYQVDHIDFNPANNHITNLQYLTPSQNVKRAFDAGRRCMKGRAHPASKLTEANVYAIRGSTAKARDIAAEFGVRCGTIKNIRNRETWNHLPPDSAELDRKATAPRARRRAK